MRIKEGRTIMKFNEIDEQELNNFREQYKQTKLTEWQSLTDSEKIAKLGKEKYKF